MRFAITGVGGFVAPRHLEAIKAVGGTVVAALDPHDAVGVLDRYDLNTEFFTEPERFERHLHKLQRANTPIDWLSVCSPNHVHDLHAQMGLRNGANVICEKPVCLSPWNLDALEVDEHDTGRRVWVVLQCRLMPQLQELKRKIDANPDLPHVVSLDYATPRGRWYERSWKGDPAKSGGVMMNIGVHMFDLLIWIFGPVGVFRMFRRTADHAQGFLALQRANVNWSLRLSGEASRKLVVDGEEIDFTTGFVGLHTKLYEETIAGHGFGLTEARPAVELVHSMREAEVRPGR